MSSTISYRRIISKTCAALAFAMLAVPSTAVEARQVKNAIKWQQEDQTMSISHEPQNISANFQFLNQAQIPIKIDRVHASCDCLKVEYPHSQIQPTASGELKVQIHTGEAPGETRHTITVFDSNGGQYVLNVTIIVNSEVSLTSRLALWKRGEKCTTKQIRLKCNIPNAAINGIELHATNPTFKITSQYESTSQDYIIEITPTTTVNRASGIIEIELLSTKERLPSATIYTYIK